MNDKEHITHTAILWPNGDPESLPIPASHYQISKVMLKKDPDVPALREPSRQGFLTSTGRFVGRREAYRIALEAGQIDPTKTYQPDILFSEDLKEAEVEA